MPRSCVQLLLLKATDELHSSFDTRLLDAAGGVGCTKLAAHNEKRENKPMREAPTLSQVSSRLFGESSASPSLDRGQFRIEDLSRATSLSR